MAAAAQVLCFNSCAPLVSYLDAGLRELSLAHNRFTSLPSALSTATALERLDLRGNAGLQLSQADFGLLRSLPRLERLRVNAAILQQCHDSLPHVKCSISF